MKLEEVKTEDDIRQYLYDNFTLDETSINLIINVLNELEVFANDAPNAIKRIFDCVDFTEDEVNKFIEVANS